MLNGALVKNNKQIQFLCTILLALIYIVSSNFLSFISTIIYLTYIKCDKYILSPNKFNVILSAIFTILFIPFLDFINLFITWLKILFLIQNLKYFFESSDIELYNSLNYIFSFSNFFNLNSNYLSWNIVLFVKKMKFLYKYIKLDDNMFIDTLKKINKYNYIINYQLKVYEEKLKLLLFNLNSNRTLYNKSETTFKDYLIVFILFLLLISRGIL